MSDDAKSGCPICGDRYTSFCADGLHANPIAEPKNQAWKRYAADFKGMTDAEIDSEEERARNLVDEQEDWLEAVASWKAAGRPRT